MQITSRCEPFGDLGLMPAACPWILRQLVRGWVNEPAIQKLGALEVGVMRIAPMIVSNFFLEGTFLEGSIFFLSHSASSALL